MRATEHIGYHLGHVFGYGGTEMPLSTVVAMNAIVDSINMVIYR